MAELSNFQLNMLGKVVASAVFEHFRNPENMEKFNKWFIERYGITYEESKARGMEYEDLEEMRKCNTLVT